MEYSSNAKGNLGVTLGAIGTGLGALGNSGIVQGFTGNSTSSNYVSKDEMQMIQDLAAKDSEIALLKAESTAEEKMIDVYKQAHTEVAALRDYTNSELKEIRTEMSSNRRDQDLWNATQSVANAQMSAAIATNANSISSLQAIINSVTETKVPNTSVCPGWGNITITPSTTTTTSTT